jgi:hypothetical protein
MRLPSSSLFVILSTVAAFACGGKSDVPLDGDGGGDDDDVIDGGGTGFVADANLHDVVPCTEPDVSQPQCNNCIDDDEDGLIDGFDPECVSAIDNDEGSFATGIPGDNIDAKKQDCFFDGNSGSDYGQQISTCCLLPDGECPNDAGGGADGVGSFDRETDCEYSQQAIDYCAPLTPPGCDCFGCCTVCVEAGCFEVLGNDTVSPDCTQETVGTDACPTCVKQSECGGEQCNADPEDCILCPGETAEDLPEACNEVNVCPGDQTECTPGGGECSDTQYCSSGCCVAGVP